MHTLFNGELKVDCNQFYVDSRPRPGGPYDLGEAFGGQCNGLCGAAAPGYLYLLTGLHSGHVGLVVELHDEPPPVDAGWEEIVEVPFLPESAEVGIVAGANAQCYWPLGPFPRVSHRVRYCASGVEEGRWTDIRRADEPQVDRYLIQCWPAPAQPDRVLKLTSDVAAEQHQCARRLPARPHTPPHPPPHPPPSSPPPAPPPPPAEGHVADRAEGSAAGARPGGGAAEREWPAREPGRRDGHPPHERLRRLQHHVPHMVRLDPALAEAVAEAEPGVQRSLARWAARRACEAAGLARIDWIAAALTALRRGEALPPPFHDVPRTWQLLWSDERLTHSVVRACNGRTGNVSQQAAAIPALWGAAEAEPLRAALEALEAATVTFGDNYAALFEEIRMTFPALAGHST